MNTITRRGFLASGAAGATSIPGVSTGCMKIVGGKAIVSPMATAAASSSPVATPRQ